MTNILFLGCGKMGSILRENILENKSAKASQIKVLRKSQKDSLPKNYRADLVFICIKPQSCEEVLINFAQEKFLHKDTIFISILAGKKIEFFEKIFGKKAKIIRSMPNLPIQDSQGLFAYLANKNISALEQKNLAKIFEKFGSAFALKNEKDFDAITAIFGSGPAYIFLLQEIFSEIATSCKIPKDKASQLVENLFLGSALMSCNSNLGFEKLRDSVTSKGGTTEAALKVLQKNSALKKLFSQAIDAAISRSRDLSS